MNLFYMLIICAAVTQAQSTGGDTEILNEKQKRQQERRERIQAKKALRKQQRQNSIKKKRAERKAAKEKKLKDKITGNGTGSGGQTTVVVPTTTSFGQNFVDGENFEWGFDIDDAETTMATTTVFIESFTSVKSASDPVLTTLATTPTSTTTSSTTTSTSTTSTSTTSSSTTTSTSTSTTTSTTIAKTTTVPTTKLETSTAATESSTVENESEPENTTVQNPENILPDDFSNFLNDLSGLITPKSKFLLVINYDSFQMIDF